MGVERTGRKVELFFDQGGLIAEEHSSRRFWVVGSGEVAGTEGRDS